jgi:hypothetical protein
MLLVLPFLKGPDSMVAGNAVGTVSMQRDQFIGLTNDTFAIRFSLTPPMQHRHLPAYSAYKATVAWLFTRVSERIRAVKIG